VPDEDVQNAIALNWFQLNASRIIWPTMSGGLIALTGIGGALLVCVISLLFGVVTLLPIQDPDPDRQRGGHASPIVEMMEGLRYSMTTPVIAMVLTLVVAIGMFGLAFMNVGPAYGKEELGLNAAETGVFMMALGIGSIIGNTALLYIEVKNRNLVFVLLSAAFALSLIGLALSPWYAVAFLCVALFGLFNASIVVVAQTIFQDVVPPHLMGRVLSIFMQAPGLAMIASLPIGVVGDLVGLRWAIGGISLLLLVSTVVLAAIYLPRLQREDKERALKLEASEAKA
jgi:ENTS family enterobactin (siderophore) exporter